MNMAERAINSLFFHDLTRYCRFLRTKSKDSDEKAHNKSSTEHDGPNNEEFLKERLTKVKEGKLSFQDMFKQILDRVKKDAQRNMQQEMAKQATSSDKSKQSGEIPKFEIPGQPLPKATMIKFFVFGCIGSLLMWILLLRFIGGSEGGKLLDYDAVPFDVFLNRYLPTGEVMKIMHSPNDKRALAFMHQGAIIDGQPVKNRAVAIILDREILRNSEQFRNEIRSFEQTLGIQSPNGIPIESVPTPSTFRMIEFIIGMAILSWLGFQYGRLISKRLFINANKKAGNTKNGEKNAQ